MESLNWSVEEKVYPIPKPDIVEVYVALLEKVIANLRETKTFRMGDEIEIVHSYQIPTVIFAYVEKNSAHDYRLFKLFCYSDRRDFLRGMEDFGDGEIAKPHLRKNKKI